MDVRALPRDRLEWVGSGATTIRAAILGLGPHGRRIARAISSSPRIELVAGVDTNRGAANETDALGATVYSSSAALWENGGAELVCVATNGPSHAALALEAIEAGARFVLIEKPMACSLAECDAIVAAASEAGVRVAVDHPRRYNRGYTWVRAGVHEGRWGQLRTMWIQRPGIGLGCLGTHSFDLARFLSGQEILRVTAWIDEPRTTNPRGAEFVDPGGLIVLEMSDGLRAVVAQVEDGAGPMSVELDFTGARIRIDERAAELELVVRDTTVPKGPDSPAKHSLSLNPAGSLLRRDLVGEIRTLLEELTSEDPVSSDERQGVASIEALVGAYLSHRQGNVPIALPCSDPSDRALWLPVT
jgi:predicted dehydrogenase